MKKCRNSIGLIPSELASSFMLTPQSLRDSSPIKAGEHFGTLGYVISLVAQANRVSKCKSPPALIGGVVRRTEGVRVKNVETLLI